jgi:hypothetical protein
MGAGGSRAGGRLVEEQLEDCLTGHMRWHKAGRTIRQIECQEHLGAPGAEVSDSKSTVAEGNR